MPVAPTGSNPLRLGKVTRRPLAREDLTEIWSYIAEDNEGAADGVLDRIDEVLSMLADNPRAGRSRTELSRGLRSFPVGNDVPYYTSADTGIELVRVRSGYLDIRSEDFEG